MTQDDARRLIIEMTAEWVDDEESAVVWSGEYEGRLGLRMSQETRDFTTLWFEIGQRTVGLEAYLLPAPQVHREEVYRQCLFRNRRSWPVSIAVDRDGDLYIGGRISLDLLDRARLDQAVAAVYELVDLSFRSLVRIGFSGREKTT